jgi:signal transduction histidine kinase
MGRSFTSLMTDRRPILWTDPRIDLVLYAGAVTINLVRRLYAEPRVPDPPRRVWRDWVLVGVLVPTAILEGIFRDDVAWRPVAVALSVGLAFTMLWRRTQPLAVIMVAFGSAALLNLVPLLSGGDPVGLDTTVFIVLLPYSLTRWGSGRDTAIGLVFILAAVVTGLASDYTGAADAVFATLFVLSPVLLGGLVRFATTAHQREMNEVKLKEREQLARELHDTVAHHVSAIAVRAQAGRVLAATDPTAGADALEVIEEEASRTLDELRAMVRGLRDTSEPALAPQPGVADIDRLARSVGDAPLVEVDLKGQLDDLAPSVGAAIYRIAQESITNAVRHARHATRVDIEIVGDDDCVRLTVHDDGDTSSVGANPVGYGLVGMAERATLLGGSFEAGPSPEKGWTVHAVLPKLIPST